MTSVASVSDANGGRSSTHQKKPVMKIGLPFSGNREKVIDLRLLKVKLETSKKRNRGYFDALGHQPLLAECERLIRNDVFYVRVNVVHLEEADNGIETYRFKLIDKVDFPSRTERLCTEVFRELSEVKMKKA